ncbi:MAG: DMT family transporter, partial [Rhodothalassiaceae bacterium]
VAVVFSMMSLINQVNGAIFLRQPLEGRVFLAAVAGLAGLGLIFRPELAVFDVTGDVVRGVGLCLAATLFASFGNTLAAGSRARTLPLFAFNGYAMLYGAVLMALLALAGGKALAFDFRAPFVLSLLYLALAGSVLAFSLYLTLIKTIGLGRSGYVAVLIPLVALAISTLFEGYRWTASGVLGVTLVLVGNMLLLRRRGPAAVPKGVAARKSGAA